MGLLLEQFIDAAREWHRRVPQPQRESRESNVVFYIMFWTGAGRSVAPLDARDEGQLTWQQKKEMTMAEIHGYYSLDQVRAHLDELMNRTGLLEIFLIPSLVRALEAELQGMVLKYEAGVDKMQERINELRGIEADPEQKAIYLEANRTVHERFIAEGKLPPDEPFDEDTAIQHNIEMFERFGGYDPSEKARREQDVALWREITMPLLTSDNLDRATDEMLKAADD